MAFSTEPHNSTRPLSTQSFSYSDLGQVPTPWKAAFPGRDPLGYWEAFSKRCAKIANGSAIVDEATARNVWMGILKDYESYQRMGMWLPEKTLEEHRLVAQILGWL